MFTAAIGSETKETTAAKDLIEYLKGPAAVLQQTAGAEIPIASDARTLTPPAVSSLGGLRTPAPLCAAPPSWGRHPQTFT